MQRTTCVAAPAGPDGGGWALESEPQRQGSHQMWAWDTVGIWEKKGGPSCAQHCSSTPPFTSSVGVGTNY